MRQKATLIFLSVMMVFGMIAAGCKGDMTFQDLKTIMGTWDAANAERITLNGDTIGPPDLTMVAKDVDGNQTEDLVFGGETGWLWGATNSSFTGISSSGNYIELRGASDSPVCPDQLIDAGSNSAAAIGDYDNDNNWELVIGNAAGEVFYGDVVSYNPVELHMTYAQDVNDGQTIMVPGGYAAPATGDVVGDELMDLVVGAGDGRLYVYENVGTSDWPRVTYWGELSVDVGERAAPVLKDLDGDGELELIIGNAAGEIFACDGIETACTNLGQYVEKNANPTVADFNHDGLWDLAIASGNGKAWLVPSVSEE
ncbi:MAG: FG-GAP-like repeat-containing protein [bacterium]